MKRLILSAFLVMSLSGCEAIGGSTPILNGQSVSQANPKISLEAQKILIATHQAYNALGQLLIDNAHSGLIHGQTAANAKKLYDKAGDALLLADAAETSSNEANLFTAISDAKSLIAQARTLLGVN